MSKSKNSNDPNKADEHKDLTEEKCRAVELTAQGLRPSEVAEEIGVGRKTIWSWIKHDSACRRYLVELIDEHKAEAKRYATHRARMVIERMIDIVEGGPVIDKETKQVIKAGPSAWAKIAAARVIVAIAGLEEQVVRVEGDLSGTIEHEVKQLTDEQLQERTRKALDRAQRLRNLVGRTGSN